MELVADPFPVDPESCSRHILGAQDARNLLFVPKLVFDITLVLLAKTPRPIKESTRQWSGGVVYRQTSWWLSVDDGRRWSTMVDDRGRGGS